MPTTGKTICLRRRRRLAGRPATRSARPSARTRILGLSSGGCVMGSGRAEGPDGLADAPRALVRVPCRDEDRRLREAGAGRVRHKRIDPATKRLDRSGEGALNAFDANAVEEALRLKEAGGEGEVVLVSIGPANAARRAAQGARDGRRPRACSSPTTRPPARTWSPRAARSPPRSSASRRSSCSSASRRATPTAPCLWAAVAERLQRPMISQVAELTRRGRRGARQAPDRVRLRRDRGAAARGRRGLGRDQRAALPVAQGDHGRQEEAAGDALARRPRRRRRPGGRGGLADDGRSRWATRRRAATR